MKKSKPAAIQGERDMGYITIVNKGQLLPPKEFDSKRYVIKWSKVGSGVDLASREQIVKGRVEAPGWSVWRNPKTKKAYIVHLSNGKYVLMVRPKGIQSRLNRLCGNLSRERIVTEKHGHTVNEQPAERGMLGEHVLDKFTGERDDEGDGYAGAFNRVEPLEEAAVAHLR